MNEENINQEFNPNKAGFFEGSISGTDEEDQLEPHFIFQEELI